MAFLSKIWHYLRWPLAVLVVFYILVVLYRIPAVGEQQRTQEAIAKIQSQHITLSDVMGDALPPVPNTEENNATVAGIDKNNNGIRDDVELAIFKLHATSSKVRAAELQYAMAEQMFLTDVFNTDTWKAAAESDDRGYQCVGESVPVTTDFTADIKQINTLLKEVKDLVLNTQTRKDTEYKASLYTTSYGSSNQSPCDIDLNTLPN